MIASNKNNKCSSCKNPTNSSFQCQSESCRLKNEFYIETISCPQCNQIIKLCEIENHKCFCPYCKSQILTEFYIDHLKICQEQRARTIRDEINRAQDLAKSVQQKAKLIQSNPDWQNNSRGVHAYQNLLNSIGGPNPSLVFNNGISNPIIGQKGLKKDEIDRFPLLFFQKNNKLTENCMICLEILKEKEKTRLLPCFHQFHFGCIDEWMTQNIFCPICKLNLRNI